MTAKAKPKQDDKPDAKKDPKTSSTRGAKPPEEADPAKQTPSGQERLPGQPVDTPTADSKGSKHSVTVTIEAVHSGVLDNLRKASSRKEYIQAVVDRHLQAANPNGSWQEDDDLPGNEREVKSPNFRI